MKFPPNPSSDAPRGVNYFPHESKEAMEGQRIKIGEIYIPEHRDQGWQPVEKIIWPKPEAPILPTSADKRSIFVAIAAFRDGSRCGKTLYDLETKAKHPSRVAVGIVQQNEEGDADCLERYCELMESNGRICDVTGMRLLNLPAQESQGPVWGRHWQQYLLGDEEFCMQIDSHMAFASNWDEKVLGDWELAQNGELLRFHCSLPSNTVTGD